MKKSSLNKKGNGVAYAICILVIKVMVYINTLISLLNSSIIAKI
jgi:hypothetical protein